MCFSDLSGEGKADFEEPKRQEKGISVNMVGNSSFLGFGGGHAEKYFLPLGACRCDQSLQGSQPGILCHWLQMQLMCSQF